MFTLEISQKVFYGSQFQAYTHILNVKEKQTFFAISMFITAVLALRIPVDQASW